MIPIVEMFYSLQGEGPRIVPAVFIRSALCNFTCKGFGCKIETPLKNDIIGCDSIRAVNPDFKECWINYASYEDLIVDVEKILPHYSRHNIIKPDIVWTGGEPLIYWNDVIMQRTLSHYMSRGHAITIETNGSLPIEFKREFQKNIMFSISVKLSNSGEPEHKRINIDNLTNIVENNPKSYFKFVVSEATWEEDWKEIRLILKSIPVFVPVFLMPLGENKTQLDRNTQFVFQKCIDLGFMYSDRLHIRAFNDKAGV